MHDPAELPFEIFIDILYDVIEGKPDQSVYFYGLVPADLCLVNHRWHAIVSTLLYSRSGFDGEVRRQKSLWCFFRTIMSNPSLAANVRNLSFTCRYTERNEQAAALLYSENDSLIRQALAQAGLGGRDPGLEAKAHEALKSDDRRPLVALILAHVPNLTTLEMHVARSDPFLEAILSRSVGDPSDDYEAPSSLGLQNLRRLYLGTAEHYRRLGYRTDINYPVCINQNRPFTRLPKLQELFLLDAQLDDELIDPLQTATTISNITQLTVAFFSPVKNLKPLLEHTANLTHLSLALPDTHQDATLNMHQELWSALLPFSQKLEYLDIYQGNILHMSLSSPRLFPNDTDKSFCCPLRRFTKVRQLSITPLLLYGHRCRHEPLRKFINHLPPTLESLGLYNSDHSWLKKHIEQMDREMQAIPLMKPTIPLNSIVVDSEYCPRTSYGLPYAWMKYSAEQKRIMFNTMAHYFLFFGGRETQFAMATYSVLSRKFLRGLLDGEKVRDIMPRGLEVHTFRGTLDDDWV